MFWFLWINELSTVELHTSEGSSWSFFSAVSNKFDSTVVLWRHKSLKIKTNKPTLSVWLDPTTGKWENSYFIMTVFVSSKTWGWFLRLLASLAHRGLKQNGQTMRQDAGRTQTEMISRKHLPMYSWRYVFLLPRWSLSFRLSFSVGSSSALFISRLLDLVTLPFYGAALKIGSPQWGIVRSPALGTCQTLIQPDGTQGVCAEISLQELWSIQNSLHSDVPLT